MSFTHHQHQLFLFYELSLLPLIGGSLLDISDFSFTSLIANLENSEFNSLSLDTTSAQLIFPQILDSIPNIYRRIKWIKLSSSNPPIEFKKEIVKAFKHAKIVLGYGLSEYMRAAFLCLNDNAELLGVENSNCVGFPFPNTQVRILNSKTSLLSHYGEGELCLKGSHLARAIFVKNPCGIVNL